MASTSDPQQRERGFVPARNDEERLLMRRAEDLARTALSRGIPRHSGFLSDREQDLCRAAMGRCGCTDFCFEGGWPQAERRVLCICPPDACWQEQPVQCLVVQARLAAGAAPPAHQDYLGALMGLELERRCIGDILPDPACPGRAYLFALEDKADFLCRELTEVGRLRVSTSCCDPALAAALEQPPRELKTGTVPSLRLDAVLAEMLGAGRGQAAEWIAAGRVEINHIPELRGHAAVFAGDVFTLRGKGKFKLNQIIGKSKKDRTIIEYFQFQ